MVSVIIVDTTQLNAISNDIFSCKSNFEKAIIKFIFEQQYKYNNNICQFEIILPDNLSKEQRHIVHKYSKSNELYTQTFENENSNRQLSLFLSKKYIKKLLLQYVSQFKDDESSDDSKESINSIISDISSNTSSTIINENNKNQNKAKIIKKYDLSSIYDNNIVCFICGFMCGIYVNKILKIKQD
jgi:hypothetical protein